VGDKAKEEKKRKSSFLAFSLVSLNKSWGGREGSRRRKKGAPETGEKQEKKTEKWDSFLLFLSVWRKKTKTEGESLPQTAYL